MYSCYRVHSIQPTYNVHYGIWCMYNVPYGIILSPIYIYISLIWVIFIPYIYPLSLIGVYRYVIHYKISSLSVSVTTEPAYTVYTGLHCINNVRWLYPIGYPLVY